jgi:hypothetical protein
MSFSHPEYNNLNRYLSENLIFIQTFKSFIKFSPAFITSSLFFPLLSPYLGAGSHIGAQGCLLSFLDLSQVVGLLGRVISSSQGLYLHIGQHKHRKTRIHIKHPYPRRDSNSQTRPPNDRRLFLPQTARLPRSAPLS